MSEDISRKTILVLVILTVIVSTLGTLTVLDSVNRAGVATEVPAPSDATTTTQGQVTLRIAEPPPQVTGQVVLRLLPPN